MLLCCSMATPLCAGTGREVATTAGLSALAASIDLHSTEMAQRAGAEERGLGKTTAARIGLKLGGVTAVVLLDHSLRKRGHKRAATAVRWIFVALNLGAAANNYAQSRRR